MENATSIYNLHDEPSQRKMPVPVMSYSDVLKNLQEEPVQAPVQQQPAPVPVPVPVQQEQQPEVVQFHPQPPVLQQQQPHVPEKEDFQSRSFQNDMLVLLSVYIVVHMASSQKWIQSKVPNLINPDTGAMSVLGLLMNGMLVIVMWNISKKMVAKYLKEL